MVPKIGLYGLKRSVFNQWPIGDPKQEIKQTLQDMENIKGEIHPRILFSKFSFNQMFPVSCRVHH